MGSLDKAVITGFICRLCSKMNRFVVHIYGEEGVRLRLAEKINVYLPITITANDPLPKTVCVPCIQRLETHHELMKQFTVARSRLLEASKRAIPSPEPPQVNRTVRQRLLPSTQSVPVRSPESPSQTGTSHIISTPPQEEE